MTADRIVEDYVERLEAASRHLPDDRRTELLAEIREHIDHALSETGTEDELAVRNALERLGPPEDIVSAAEPAPAPRSDTRLARRPWLEIAAVIALLIPLAGWVVGFVLVALSRIWSNREKAVALALILAAIVLPALEVASSAGGMEESVPVPVGDPIEPPTSDNVGTGEFFLILLGGLPAAVFLAWRLSLRRQSL